MQYEEFLKIAKLTPHDMDRHEYETGVEIVYMHHPAIRNTDGKQQIADLYRQGLIRELLPRAKAIRDGEDALHTAQLENRQILLRQHDESIEIMARQLQEREDLAARQAAECDRIQAKITQARNDLAVLGG